MDPVENMNRCMSNNYSVTGFWRNWHCSYNRWLIRYVYIPLGGSKTQHWNIFVVFTFVAIWHDISLSLLAWGWLVSLFILPEVAAHKIFRTSKVCFSYRLCLGELCVIEWEFFHPATSSQAELPEQIDSNSLYSNFSGEHGHTTVIFALLEVSSTSSS